MVPRLLSLVVAHSPVLLMARVNNYLACMAVGIIAMVVFASARSLILATAPRIWLALGPVILPVVAQEAVGTLANLHWFLLWGCFWVLWHRGRSWLTIAATTAFMALASLSEIQAVLFAPVAVVALILQPRKPLRTLLPTLAWAIGSAMQIAATLERPRPGGVQAPTLDAFERLFAGQVLLPLLSNNPATLHEWLDRSTWYEAWLLMGLFAAALTYCLLRGSWAIRWAAAAAASSAVALFATALTRNPRSQSLSALSHTAPAASMLTRYAITPQLLLMAALALGWGLSVRRGNRPIQMLITTWVLATLVVGVLNLHAPGNRRSPKLLWAGQVAIAEEACATEPLRRIRIPISPGYNWLVDMPCRRLRGVDRVDARFPRVGSMAHPAP